MQLEPSSVLVCVCASKHVYLGDQQASCNQSLYYQKHPCGRSLSVIGLNACMTKTLVSMATDSSHMVIFEPRREKTGL